MRNLQVVRKVVSSSPLALARSSVFCAGEHGSILRVIRGGLDDEKQSEDSVNKVWPSLTRIAKYGRVEELVESSLLQDVFLIQFISDTGCLYLGTKGGNFLQFCLHLGDVEELFQSKTGLAAFAVSPDSRFVAIITSTGCLLLMSLIHLDVIVEEKLFESSLKDENAAGLFSVNLCWRQDSQYFVVNIPDDDTGRRLKVFDENGTLFSTTEASTYLFNDVVEWQPSGGLIAGIENAPTGKEGFLISFFELNGLKRSSFNPNEGLTTGAVEDVIRLTWNMSSDLLALQKFKSIELWHRSNYVWMCKYVIQRQITESVFDEIMFCEWDRESPYKIFIVFGSGDYSFYHLSLNYSSGHSAGSAIAVTVNGEKLYCTPFRDSSAPPPYGFFKASVTSKVKEVVITDFWDGFLCLLISGKVIVFKHTGKDLIMCKTMSSDNETDLRNSHALVWPNLQTLCCISGDRILVFRIPDNWDSNDETIITQTGVISMACSSLSALSDTNFLTGAECIIGRKVDGCMTLINLKSGGLPTFLFKIPTEGFHDIKYLFTRQNLMDDDYMNHVIIICHDKITRRLEIFLGSACAKVSTDCTSTSIFDGHLLFTTVQGTLEILYTSQLQNLLTASVLNNPRPELQQYSRKIEKGSLLVNSCWNRMLEPTVILQVLPRGNIETIHPRPLVIASMKELLRDEKKRSFNVIMRALRKHRIDANVLMDELKEVERKGDSGLTMKDAFESMVSEVSDSNLLVLFVTEVNAHNSDCLHLMKSILEKHAINAKDKNAVQPYLSTMAKLGLYEDVLNSELITGEDDREVVKGRIKFLSFYADNADTLYEAALGTYDINLTAIVADCLSKDPKEYLPILNNYRSMAELKKRFSIDNTLKKWAKGLKSLLEDASVNIDEVSKYVQRHQLFSDAFTYLSSSSVLSARGEKEVSCMRKSLQNLCGEYLEAHGKYREASILYYRSGNKAKFVECCVNGGRWESALIGLDQDPEQFQKSCRDLLSSLQLKQEWECMARLCEVYLLDYRLAIQFWVKAKKWTSAHALAFQHTELQDMIIQLITPSLIQHQETLLDILTKQLEEHKYRIARLREIKAKKEALNHARAEDGDNFSDTESISTTSSLISTANTSQTGKSYRTGKNKRKMEKKLHSLKEGSRFEDIAIIAHLWESIIRIQSETTPDVAYTIESLWRFELDAKAQALTTLFDELICEVNKIIKEIWSIPLAENPLLEQKYHISPVGWTPSWPKLALPSCIS